MTDTGEYTKIVLTRPDKSYIEIGTAHNTVQSFYEEYPGMGGHYIQGYVGCQTSEVVKQLETCDWKVI